MLHQRLAGRACLLLALIGCASRGDLPRAGGAAPGPAAAPAPATNTVGDDPTSDLAITFHPGVTGHVGWAKLPRPVRVTIGWVNRLTMAFDRPSTTPEK